MTRFERDYADARNGGIEVLRERKAELDRLENEGKSCKNKWRMQCILQDYARLKNEYTALSSLF